MHKNQSYLKSHLNSKIVSDRLHNRDQYKKCGWIMDRNSKQKLLQPNASSLKDQTKWYDFDLVEIMALKNKNLHLLEPRTSSVLIHLEWFFLPKIGIFFKWTGSMNIEVGVNKNHIIAKRTAWNKFLLQKLFMYRFFAPFFFSVFLFFRCDHSTNNTKLIAPKTTENKWW